MPEHSWPLGHMWGREFRPFAFVISLATIRVTLALLTSTVTGTALDGHLGLAFGVLSALSVGYLWAGWWGKRDAWMTEGLLLSTCAWAGVSGVLFYDQGITSNSAFLAGCFAIFAAERWLLAIRRDRVAER